MQVLLPVMHGNFFLTQSQETGVIIIENAILLIQSEKIVRVYISDSQYDCLRPEHLISSRTSTRSRRGRGIRRGECNSARGLRSPGFRLILDFGTIHGLTPEQVRIAGREVTAAATEDATLLMYAFSPGRRGPLPRGISREEIEEAYSEWSIKEEEDFELTGLPRVVQKAAPRFYCLHSK